MQLAYADWMGPALRWSLRHADGLVAISNFVAETLTDGGVPSSRIHLAYNAVVLEKPSGIALEVVPVDTDEDDALCSVPLRCSLEHLRLALARNAPRCPEVQDDRLPAQRCESEGAALVEAPQ
jgi:hypothetical protein